MNRWDCSQRGCAHFVLGTGGAIGLRAVGWYVRFDARALNGPEIYCPRHRPDAIACRENHELAECSLCKAEREAKTIQDGMYSRDDEAALERAMNADGGHGARGEPGTGPHEPTETAADRPDQR